MEDKILNKRIKSLRTENGMNQSEFSEKIGITQSTLSSYENGNVSPSLDVLITIAKEFNVSLDWLFGISQVKNNITTVADIVDFIFRLNDLNEIRFELEINDRIPGDLEADKEKWYTAIKFYGNDKEHPSNQEICLFLSSLEENRSSFESYFTSGEIYELWKEKQVEYYSAIPLTKKEYPELDTATRMKLRNEQLEKKYSKT